MNDDTPTPTTPTTDLTMSPALDKLFAAMIALQAELRPVAKASTNPHFNSRYASLPDCVTELLPQLAAHGLTLMQFAANGGPGRAALVTIIGHVSGQFIRCTASCGTSKPDAQAYGSAITYLRRYSLGAVGLVTDDDDDDGNAASAPVGQPAQQGHTFGPAGLLLAPGASDGQ